MRRTSRIDRTVLRPLALGVVAAAMLGGAAAPALADGWDHGRNGDWRRQEWRDDRAWRENEWREHALRERSWRELQAHRWRERYGDFRSYPRFYAPGFYAPGYAYPPPVFYGPPALSFGFSFR